MIEQLAIEWLGPNLALLVCVFVLLTLFFVLVIGWMSKRSK